MRIDVERLSAVLPVTELVEVLKNEIARLRLTDAEREAIEIAMHRCDTPDFRTLRGLLERLKT